VPLGDDAGAVGGGGVAGQFFVEVMLGMRHEIRQVCSRHQHIVDGNTHLTILDQFGADDVADARGVDAVCGENGGALAAELERHRHKVLGRCPRDLAPDRRAAGVEQMVPAQGREFLGQRETADRDSDEILGKSGGQHALQQFRAGRGLVGRLDHRPIAGGQHLDQRAE